MMFTQNDDGSVRLEVVDFGVSEFDGGDWECWYDLDKDNAQLLFNELSKLHKGSFQEMVIAQFGDTFAIPEFVKFCKEHNIEYSHGTWW